MEGKKGDPRAKKQKSDAIQRLHAQEPTVQSRRSTWRRCALDERASVHLACARLSKAKLASRLKVSTVIFCFS
jgi:hypothetical protein